VETLRGADLILHAGDIVTRAVLDDLRTLGPPVEAVAGNMDEPALQRTLPQELIVAAEDARIGLLHIPGPAAGREARLASRFPDCGAVVYGHTHIPQVERFQHLWILNPGSPTERRRAPTHTMLVLEIRGARIVPELITLRRP
jgi:uncharacterized protein